MAAEGSLDPNVQGQAVLGFVHIDFLDQQPQVGFGHRTVRKDLIDEADVLFQFRLPGADGLAQVFQLCDFLFRLGDLFLPLGDHAVVPLGICFIPYPFHQDVLHFFFQRFHSLTQLLQLRQGIRLLGCPAVNGFLHGIPDLLVLLLGGQQLRTDDLIQLFLPDGMGAAVFFAIAQVGAAPVFGADALLAADGLG